MTLLTAKECRDTAFRKMIEAKSHGSERPELVKTAEAWQALAEQLDVAEALGTFAARDRIKSPAADGGASMYFRAIREQAVAPVESIIQRPWLKSTSINS